MLVEKKILSIDRPLPLDSGGDLDQYQLAYETYGTLNAAADNAILVVHALSGDCHAAGRYRQDDAKPGWWDILIGPGKTVDTDRYFVVCSNVIGGCMGSTGPSSINPATGRPYSLDFPFITIYDMVRAQKELLTQLGVNTLLTVMGGSMGGMQVLAWATMFPDTVRSAVVIASTSRLSAQQIAFDEVGRQCIMGDPNWHDGRYYDNRKPDIGLALARMIAHITYMSDMSLRRKFDRQLQEKDTFSFHFEKEFQVESYLHHQGSRFVERFDANSYLYLTRAMDYFDLAEEKGHLAGALETARSTKFLIVSYTSDWLFPTYQSKDIVRALKSNNQDVTFCELDSDYGHDAFLLPNEEFNLIITNFLGHVE